MTENEFTTKLKKSFIKTGLYETKFTKNGRIPFSALKEHQNHNLYVTKHGMFRYKPPDNTGYQNPADMIVINKGVAYVVCVFWQRGCDTAYLIDIDVWNDTRSSSTRKSLTSVEAMGISEKVIHL